MQNHWQIRLLKREQRYSAAQRSFILRMMITRRVLQLERFPASCEISSPIGRFCTTTKANPTTRRTSARWQSLSRAGQERLEGAI